jgi:DNA-binding SARP family transcriptional activator/tetratricopeptide (TPR) repeat protein
MPESLRVRLLGDLQVDGVDPARLGRRQVRTLLKVLALHHDRPVGLDQLVDCLWGGALPAKPADQVSVLASRLRGVLGGDRLRHSDAGYTLAVDWLDVDALGAYADEAAQRLAAGAVGASRAAAVAGLSLARGPLLADEPDALWADRERIAVEQVLAQLRRTAAAAALAAEDWVGVVEAAEAALRIDPFDEPVLRMLMDALARSGRSASALARFADARSLLAEELGVSPSAETEALHTAILMGEVTAPARDSGPAEAVGMLAGREGALAQLDGLLALAASGRGQVVSVEGEAGIGKSRLLEVWSRRAEQHGAAVVTVACQEQGRALPLQPLFDAVESLIRAAGGDAAEVLGPGASVLGPLLGTPVAAEAVQLAALADPAAGQALLLAAVFGVLRRRAEDRPLVVMVDDTHLADDATTLWFGQASRRLAEARVVVVAARRSEESAAVPGATTVTLEPLDLEAVAEVVGAERAPSLLERSGGNPLFLVELAAAGAGDAVPSSIRDAVEARCVRAGPAAASLRAAAVVGRDVDLDLLAAVTGAPPGELLDHLEVGVRRRLLLEDGPAFVFAHGLIREALEATVGAARAAYIHREVARVLESRPDADPSVVARHARLGGDLARASAMLVRAARVAVARFDQQEALRLLDEALGLADSVDARLERARVRTMLAEYESAAEDIDAARSLGAGAEALEVAAWAAHLQRRFAAALDLADRGAALAGDGDVGSGCLALGGWISLATGDLAGATSRLESAVQRAGPSDDALARSWLGWLRTNQGRPDDALALVGEPSGGPSAYRFPNAYGLMARSMALAMVGRAEEALATVEALSAEVTRMGAWRWVARPLNLRGWILRNLGELAEADELNRAAIDAARASGLAEPLANALLDLASGRLLAEDLDAAAGFLDEAAGLADVEHAFRWRHQLRERLLRARLELAGGEATAAFERAESLAADAASLGVTRYEVQARLVAATAAWRPGATADLDAIGGLLDRLDQVAGLEGWWLTAEIGRRFDVGAWQDQAAGRVAALQKRAGRYGVSLERFARQRLG